MYIFKNVYFKDVLRDINLEIKEGEMIGITRESRSGKSTFLKMLNKFIIASKGEIIYNDKNILDVKSNELRKEVIMMPESPFIYGKTLEDFFRTSLSYNGKLDFDSKEIEKYLDYVFLDKKLADDTSTLSSGETKRLVLASMLLLKPRVLLLDEPVNSLDLELSEKVMENLYSYYKENNITIIYISHNRGQIDKYSTSILQVGGKEVKRIG